MTSKPSRRQRQTAVGTVHSQPPGRSVPLNQAVVHGQMSWQQYGASPIPSPETLERYNELIPNGAERFMAMVERQSDHRQELEKFVLRRDARRSDLGLVMAFIVAVFGLVLVGFLAYIDQPWVAGSFGAVELASLVAVFVGAKRTNQQRLAEKANQ